MSAEAVEAVVVIAHLAGAEILRRVALWPAVRALDEAHGATGPGDGIQAHPDRADLVAMGRKVGDVLAPDVSALFPGSLTSNWSAKIARHATP